MADAKPSKVSPRVTVQRGRLVESSACRRCGTAAGLELGWVDGGFLVPPDAPEGVEAEARKALAALPACNCAAIDARRTRLRAVGLDERTAALALVLAQGDAAPVDARALVAALGELAAKAWD